MMLHLQRDILEEFAHFAPMALQVYLPDYGLRLALEPHGERERRLAWQRAYERWKWKTDPGHRERRNRHRREMRRTNPKYGR